MKIDEDMLKVWQALRQVCGVGRLLNDFLIQILKYVPTEEAHFRSNQRG